jgi:cytochrome c-type biogenesis protein CcmF
VHAFSSGSIGPVLLGFFAVVVFLSVGLIGWRGDRLRSPGAIDSPFSREGAFLANNLLFAAFAFIVLLGTVFPLIIESVSGDRVSVGAPFFDRMSTPIGLVILFLMAVAPVLPWRSASMVTLRDRLWWPAWTAVVALVLALLLGARGVAPLIGFLLAGLATRRHGWRGFVGRANGGMIVHLGIVVVAVALVASQAYVRQGEFTLSKGETAHVGGHTFEYLGERVLEKSNRREVRARIKVDGGQVFEPSNNHYVASGMTVTRPSVKVTQTVDLYMNLTSEPTAEDSSIRVRIIVEPLIVWLWIGGAIMLIGTALAAFPGRRRDPLAAVSADPVSADPAAAEAADTRATEPAKANS